MYLGAKMSESKAGWVEDKAGDCWTLALSKHIQAFIIRQDWVRQGIQYHNKTRYELTVCELDETTKFKTLHGAKRRAESILTRELAEATKSLEGMKK